MFVYYFSNENDYFDKKKLIQPANIINKNKFYRHTSTLLLHPISKHRLYFTFQKVDLYLKLFKWCKVTILLIFF